MSLTRANVAYNLHTSPHLVEVEYGGHKVTYHFSSELYTHKFRERVESNREDISTSLSKRFGIIINFELIADLRLYKSIEKRGYLISVDGDKIECQEHIILDGLRMIARR